MINIGANSVLSVSPNGAISCVTKGEGKDLPPDAAFWGANLRSECYISRY